MTDWEYENLQRQFSAKLIDKRRLLTNKEVEYNKGVLACKSILHAEYTREKERSRHDRP